MIKAVEWLIGGVALLGIWITALLNLRSFQLSSFETTLILYLPLWGVLSFGLISIGIIAYRTATLRDCPEAAKELTLQIKEAKADLKRKGLKF
ncbi:hypothetical protein BV898_06747 [Hypsibius exemplaris]|uniref:Dolichol-phosphate mannosyltransferase subunit 3 n=1 Tax=Hypsibius exemplaris TaxID=2072580 RepID=A0A1W0WVC1_HYPEX|nr:hypothetical protein BV898_06747 [Hypsibius exemplaris]